MKILKRIISVLSLIVLALSFAACSKAVPSKVVSGQTPEKSEKVDSKKIEDTKKPASGTISDDLYKYEVLIDGVKYTLPDSFSTLGKNGWVGEDFGDNKLKPNQMYHGNAKNDKKSISVTMVNFGLDVLPLSECLAAGIGVDSSLKTIPIPTITIAKGITIGSTYDEIIAAYGTPSDERKNDMYITLTYTSGTYSSYVFQIDSKTKKLYSLDIKNVEPPAKVSSTSVVTELPEVVKNYKAPSSVGDDLLAFQMKYGGVYYKLPVPIAEMIKNGWVLKSNSDKLIAANDTVVGIELLKDNQVLRTQVENYSDKGQPIKNCFATYIEYYNNGAMIHLELPKGISEKSTIDEVIAAYGKPTSTDENSTFKYYEYGKVFQKVTFMTRNGKIEKIEVNYSPKTLK